MQAFLKNIFLKLKTGVIFPKSWILYSMFSVFFKVYFGAEN